MNLSMGYSIDALLQRIDECGEVGERILASSAKDEAAIKKFCGDVQVLAEESFGGPTTLSREFESKASYGRNTVEEGLAALKHLHLSLVYSAELGLA